MRQDRVSHCSSTVRVLASRSHSWTQHRSTGTAIYLYGNTTSAYTVELDNSISSLSPGPSENHLLFSADDLNDTIHTINVTALPTDVGQQLAFDRAIVTATVPDQYVLHDRYAFMQSSQPSTERRRLWLTTRIRQCCITVVAGASPTIRKFQTHNIRLHSMSVPTQAILWR